MAEFGVLSVSSRPSVGKGPARAARRAGKVPAVIYGAKSAALPIALDPKELDAELHKPGFFARLFDLEVDGKKQRVLCRDVQFHPVKDNPVHVDFMRVSATTRITVDVPVHFINEETCPGLKRGGVLNVVRHVIELNSRADSILPEIVIDLEGRDIGDSIHISEVNLPADTTPTIADRDFTIATIAAPTVAAEEVEEAEDEAEGETAETVTTAEEGGEPEN